MILRILRISHVEFDFRARRKCAREEMVKCNGIFQLSLFSRLFRPTSYAQKFEIKIPEMSVPFAHPHGNSAFFCRMESTSDSQSNTWMLRLTNTLPIANLKKKKCGFQSDLPLAFVSGMNKALYQFVLSSFSRVLSRFFAREALRVRAWGRSIMCGQNP